MSRSTRRVLRPVAAALTASALALTGCSSGGDNTASSSSAVGSQPSSAASSAGGSASTAGLEKFYNQKLQWSDCQGVQCAKLTVPIDYANPSGQTIQLAISKVAAKGKAKGSLVVNPGGPGASGYDFGAAADTIVTPKIRQSYDVIGFDPRGVGRSAPITCFSDSQMDTMLGVDPTPDNRAEEVSVQAEYAKFAQACKDKAGPLLGHVSTVDVAKDVDILRAALGRDTLDYLGFSYGTFIGSTYAGLFPKRVGRFVLDGVVPPDLTSDEMNLGQATGFEQATRSYVEDCNAKGNCFLGTGVDAGLERISDFLKQLDSKPLPVSGQGPVKQLTEGWATMGLAYGFYDRGLWPTLTDALTAAMAGDASKLMTMADSYASRQANGVYADNSMQAFYAVSCLDRKTSSNLADYEKTADSFAQKAPTWGRMLAWGSLPCSEWKVPATGKEQVVRAEGAAPILVVGNTRDPATPLEFAQRLTKELANARLLTYDADGHTAYGNKSDCVNSAVDSYLLEGTMPAVGTMC